MYKQFLSALEKAVISSKREIEDIELVAVSKKKTVNDIQIVIDQGHISFGENQTQEIESKWPLIKSNQPNLKLNFIGSIQSRKAESIYEHCDVIHSLDRIKIVKIFNKLEKSKKIIREYFIQINTGNEAQKSGVMMKEADEFISQCLREYGLKIIGLMCIPPVDDDPKKHFLNLKALADNFNLQKLSMGMSNDYDVAIACGATHIRVGTQIFGARN
ncbi:MAG: YggS family pyridoxal phosphate-dependent enzyme [Rickettsiales bacterium]|nr:YggS family pyridoxal phosphate-dependent enzyme [Rickettsiales bacterium]|tara:strand:- start:74 stop:721 length:648 start_codon:yes stop_codon:yes gene_type:complete